MNQLETSEKIAVILYVTGGLLLLISAYVIYYRVYKKRGTLKAVSNVSLITSRYDKYKEKTQFLIDVPESTTIEFILLDQNHQPIFTFVNELLKSGQHPIVFDPIELSQGVYFLSLKTPNTNILRKITIEK